jgi:splicing factor 3A subunit 3
MYLISKVKETNSYQLRFLYLQMYTKEQEESVGAALLAACDILEKARCLESEKEANLYMASTMLQYPPVAEATLDISDYPGGIQDAWTVISEASHPNSNTPVNPMDAVTKKETTELPLGSGQLAKATHMTALGSEIHRAVEISKELKERRPKDGQTLKRAMDTVLAHHDPKLWLSVFDKRLKEIRSYHARNDIMDASNKRLKLGNPAADGYDLASSLTQQLDQLKEGTLFRAEEVMGKYLDLRSLYEESIVPIKDLFLSDEKKSFGLSDFLSMLHKGLHTVKEDNKLKDRKKYVRFLRALETYLDAFLKRTQPLLNLEEVVQPAMKVFEEEWKKSGGALGWEPKAAEAAMVDSSSSSAEGITAGIDLSGYKNAEDLEKAEDPDKLKAELARLGMKCGGTPLDRAKRLFLTKDTPLDQLPKKVFAKKPAEGDTANNGGVKNESRIDIARREATVTALLNQLRPTLEATLRRNERYETQTPNERDKEVSEDLYGAAVEGVKEKRDSDDEDDDDEEEAPIYNPKGVPLGWDGKPIPYWLYKLHGLSQFFPCEICGNESYRGRRNFETHFADAKHAFGMKSLGIPNTKHFHGVTKIEDAQNLWAKLKEQLKSSQFDGSRDEEYEDSHGNVLSRTTYEDLARQGLL